MTQGNGTSAKKEPVSDVLGLVPRMPLTPMELIANAIAQNADVDKLAKLMDLQERWEKNEAAKAFVVAMADFKANAPTLTKSKRVNFASSKGDVDYRYSPLDQVADVIGRELSKYGLSFRWATAQQDSLISVTCILQHVGGHSEAVTLAGAPDNTGAKNSVQAIGSTVTYLERYTLLAATGMAAKDQDNDGSGAAKMPDIAERIEWIKNCRTPEELQRVFGDAYKQAAKLGAIDAMKALIEAKDAKRRDF